MKVSGGGPGEGSWAVMYEMCILNGTSEGTKEIWWKKKNLDIRHTAGDGERGV